MLQLFNVQRPYMYNFKNVPVSYISQVPSGLPRNLEAALHRYGSSTYKAHAVTVLDQNGKPTVNLTYGEMFFSYLAMFKVLMKSSGSDTIMKGREKDRKAVEQIRRVFGDILGIILHSSP